MPNCSLCVIANKVISEQNLFTNVIILHSFLHLCCNPDHLNWHTTILTTIKRRTYSPCIVNVIHLYIHNICENCSYRLLCIFLHFAKSPLGRIGPSGFRMFDIPGLFWNYFRSETNVHGYKVPIWGCTDENELWLYRLVTEAGIWVESVTYHDWNTPTFTRESYTMRIAAVWGWSREWA